MVHKYGSTMRYDQKCCFENISIELCNIILKFCKLRHLKFLYYTRQDISGLSIIIMVLSNVQYMNMTCANIHR